MSDKKEMAVTNAILEDGELVEMIYRPEHADTRLVTYKEKKTTLWEKIDTGESILTPYSPDLELIKKGVVLFPSAITEYTSETELIQEVRQFIHRYLDVSEIFETIATYYVLLTYVYDFLPSLMYLRFVGDFGSGKSRALTVIGNLCYRPMLATGAITTSPIFRLIDKFKGTLILDEADFKFSDTYAEIIKILNSGYEKGKPVLRSEGNEKSKSWDVKAFDCYCPKIIGTRFNWRDLALESRCLSETMAKTKLREDIPISLPKNFDETTLKIRNKLLCFRFRNYKNDFSNSCELDKSIEPRLRQITGIIFNVIKDEQAREEIKEFIFKYNEQLIADRSLNYEGRLVEALYELRNTDEPTVQMVTNKFNELNADEKEMSSGKVGKILRKYLQITTRRTNKGMVIKEEHNERLKILFIKYGLEVNEVKVVKEPEGSSVGQVTHIPF